MTPPTVTIIARRKMWINGAVEPGDTVAVSPKLAATLIALGRAAAVDATQPAPLAPGDDVERAVATPARRKAERTQL